MVIVDCLVAALAGAGGGEVFEDEGVGHFCCGMVVGRGLFDVRMCGRDVMVVVVVVVGVEFKIEI